MVLYFSAEYEAKDVQPHQYSITAFCLNREHYFEQNF